MDWRLLSIYIWYYFKFGKLQLKLHKYEKIDLITVKRNNKLSKKTALQEGEYTVIFETYFLVIKK